MNGKIERLPQYTERKRGKIIKTNPRLLLPLHALGNGSVDVCVDTFTHSLRCCPYYFLLPFFDGQIDTVVCLFNKFILICCLFCFVFICHDAIYHLKHTIALIRILRNVQNAQNRSWNVVQYPMLTGRCATRYHIGTGKTDTHRTQQGGRK